MSADIRFEPSRPVPGAVAAVVATVCRTLPQDRSPIALHEPEFAGSEWAYVKNCLDTGWVSSVGAFVERFEADLARACGTRFAVVTVSGTAALHVALLLAGVQPGDEVLLPSLTFIATANAVSHAGGLPHFLDCDPDTLCLDLAAARSYLERCAIADRGVCRNRETGRRIAAIVPVHVFGHPVDPDAMAGLADRFSLAVIADATESLGSSWAGRPAASLGRLGVLSFNGNKIVTTGGGGAIVTDDEELAVAAKHLTTTAKKPHRWAFEHDRVGFNYRMPNINAALGCAQLERLAEFVARKRRLHAAYRDAFAGFSDAAILTEQGAARSNYWLVALRLDGRLAGKRDEVLEQLHAAGILSRPLWTPMHRMPMYCDHPRSDMRHTDAMFERVINLPSSPRLAPTAPRLREAD
jgi:perosamine synthetase